MLKVLNNLKLEIKALTITINNNYLQKSQVLMQAFVVLSKLSSKTFFFIQVPIITGTCTLLLSLLC